MSVVRISPATGIPFKINNQYVNIPEDWTDVIDTGDFSIAREWDAGNTFNYVDDTPQTHTLTIPIIEAENNTMAVVLSRSNTNSDFTIEFLDANDTVLQTRTGVFSVSSTNAQGTFTDNDSDFIYWSKLSTINDAVAKVRFTPETSTTINLTFSFKAPNKNLNIANFFALGSDTVGSTAISATKQYRILIKESFVTNIVSGITIRLRDTANSTSQEFYLSYAYFNDTNLTPLEDGYRVFYFTSVLGNVIEGLTAQTAVTKVDVKLHYNITPRTPGNATFPMTCGIKVQEQVNFDKALIPIMSGQDVENNTLYAEESNRGFMTQAYELPIPCTAISTVQVYWTDTTWVPELAIVNRTTGETIDIIGMELLETDYYGVIINWSDYTCEGCYEVCIRKSIDNLFLDGDSGTFEDSTVANWNLESISGATQSQDTNTFNNGSASGLFSGYGSKFILKGSTNISSNPYKDYELSAYVRWYKLPNLDGLNDYYNRSETAFRNSDNVGTIWSWLYVDEIPISNTPLVTFENDSDEYFMISVARQSGVGILTLQTKIGGSFDTIRCTTTNVLAGNLYLFAIQSNGSTWSAKINDITQTLSVIDGANTGEWLNDISTTKINVAYNQIRNWYGNNIHLQLGYASIVLSGANLTEMYNSGNFKLCAEYSFIGSVEHCWELPNNTTFPDVIGGKDLDAYGNIQTPECSLYLKSDSGSATHSYVNTSENTNTGELTYFVTNLNTGSSSSIKVGLYIEGGGYIVANVDDMELRGPYICEATSEPINLTSETDFLECEYWNNSNGQLQSYAGGWTNKMYIPGILDYQSQDTESTKYMKSNGSPRLLNSRLKQIWKLISDRLPRYFHERISVMLAHDNVKINNTKYVAEDGWEVEEKTRKKLRNGNALLARESYDQQTNNC